MSICENNGSCYENHQRAAELQDGPRTPIALQNSRRQGSATFVPDQMEAIVYEI